MSDQQRGLEQGPIWIENQPGLEWPLIPLGSEEGIYIQWSTPPQNKGDSGI